MNFVQCQANHCVYYLHFLLRFRGLQWRIGTADRERASGIMYCCLSGACLAKYGKHGSRPQLQRHIKRVASIRLIISGINNNIIYNLSVIFNAQITMHVYFFFCTTTIHPSIESARWSLSSGQINIASAKRYREGVVIDGAI